MLENGPVRPRRALVLHAVTRAESAQLREL